MAIFSDKENFYWSYHRKKQFPDKILIDKNHIIKQAKH